MGFEIKNKVALVTGGASGIGLGYVKELLLKGAKGVTVADINLENGEKVVEELKEKFGADRVTFVLTDTTNDTSFKNAFKVTIDNFKNIDILINNAGVLNDANWKQEININLVGTINGIILGLEKFLRNHKQGNEAVILNTASTTTFLMDPTVPVYTATKSGIISLSKCWGKSFHFDRTKVRVLTICPGVTETALLSDMENRLLIKDYSAQFNTTVAAPTFVLQSADFVAQQAMRIIEKAPNGSTWIVENSGPAFEYIYPEKEVFRDNVLN